MEKKSDARANTELNSEVDREEFVAVLTALEPDQLISTKDHHHCPRRQLTRSEMLLFWALRIYLLFMVGVVIYQIWTSVR
jgi:hypothetical protein